MMRSVRDDNCSVSNAPMRIFSKQRDGTQGSRIDQTLELISLELEWLRRKLTGMLNVLSHASVRDQLCVHTVHKDTREHCQYVRATHDQFLSIVHCTTPLNQKENVPTTSRISM